MGGGGSGGSSHNFRSSLLLVHVLLSTNTLYCCLGYGTLGFDIHHRFSDPVKGIMGVDELPVKGSLQYYAVMAKRDMVTRGRGLLSENSNLTFAYGNETYRISSLGFLHYANVSVGTPGLSFLVALDTGSDLFWLPCDCVSCVRGLETASGQTMKLNMYSPSKSSSSQSIPCNSSLCLSKKKCASSASGCPYFVQYLSNGTSTSGVLVEDFLHLISDDTQRKDVNVKITLGCGQVQTGSFLEGAAPNGLFGLGMSNVSVPSTLARQGYTPNSFSMCFASDGTGRISFGDKGSSGQGQTPFNLRHLLPTYNISITQIAVGGNPGNLAFTAIFDSGTSFTYLNDPAYSLITGIFNNMVKETRHTSSSDLPFEYCYDLSSNQQELQIPDLDLTMQGGDVFNVTDPIVLVSLQGNAYMYCLGVVKSGNVNIIGQNFMTGYSIVFDREKEILGWTPSNCYGNVETTQLPISPTPSAVPSTPSAVPPATAVNPQATSGNTTSNTSRNSGTNTPPGNNSPPSSPLTYALLLVVFIPFFAIV